MKICVDIQAAVAQRAGVGRYTRLLAENLVKISGNDRLAFFYFDFLRRGLSFSLPAARAVRWCPGRIVQSCWKRFAWPPFDWFAGKADLYHFTNFIIPPLSRGKKVVTIYDASFLRYPEFTEGRNLAFLSAKIGDTVKRADAIITISHFSAEELSFFFPETQNKIHVIYPGVQEHMSAEVQSSPPRADPPMAERFRVSGGSPGFAKGCAEANEPACGWQGSEGLAKGLNRPYILTVGTIEPRKNIAFLIEVFEKMEDFRGELVIVGRLGWKYDSIIERMHSSSRAVDIRFIQNASDAELNALYGNATLFVFPSLYEGFGFPPLEALAAGVPVLSSAAGALKEVLGDAAEILDGYDADQWARAALAIINDRSRRRGMIDKGRRHVSKYTWAETAKQTMALYRMLAN